MYYYFFIYILIWVQLFWVLWVNAYAVFFFFFLFLFDWKQFVLIESKTKLAEQKSSNAIIRYTNGKEKTRLLTNVISLPWLLKLHILIYEWIM